MIKQITFFAILLMAMTPIALAVGASNIVDARRIDDDGSDTSDLVITGRLAAKFAIAVIVAAFVYVQAKRSCPGPTPVIGGGDMAGQWRNFLDLDGPKDTCKQAPE
jgi:hypothetical protein